MKITEEMRAAVLAAECARYGHIIDIGEAISDDPTVYPDEHTVTIRARDDDTIPHLKCQRCPTVWLIVEGAFGYDQAEAALNARLQPKHRRMLRQQRRRERAAAQATAQAARAPEPPKQTPAPQPPAVVDGVPLPATPR